jgi:histone H3/H4
MANSSKGLRNKANAQALATADASSQNAASLELSDTVAHAIAELCWSYAEQLASDSALFAQHRDSSRVSASDAWLIARRSAGVHSRLLQRMRELDHTDSSGHFDHNAGPIGPPGAPDTD